MPKDKSIHDWKQLPPTTVLWQKQTESQLEPTECSSFSAESKPTQPTKADKGRKSQQPKANKSSQHQNQPTNKANTNLRILEAKLKGSGQNQRPNLVLGFEPSHRGASKDNICIIYQSDRLNVGNPIEVRKIFSSWDSNLHSGFEPSDRKMVWVLE